jgi:hypothetical protein
MSEADNATRAVLFQNAGLHFVVKRGDDTRLRKVGGFFSGEKLLAVGINGGGACVLRNNRTDCVLNDFV